MRLVICDRCGTEVESIQAFSEEIMASIYLSGGEVINNKSRFELYHDCTIEFLSNFLKDGENA